MVDLLQQTEAVPASYPAVPSDLSVEALTLDHDAIWARIEGHTAYRFTAREVVWTIEGREDEDWTPPLKPVVSHTAEKWENGAWVTVALDAGPLGLCLPSDGAFRITAQVGAGPTPSPVSEAFRRLAEHLADETDRAGVSEYSVTMGAISESYKRSVSWTARALQDSGAADMLRQYRRA